MHTNILALAAAATLALSPVLAHASNPEGESATQQIPTQGQSPETSSDGMVEGLNDPAPASVLEPGGAAGSEAVIAGMTVVQAAAAATTAGVLIGTVAFVAANNDNGRTSNGTSSTAAPSTSGTN